MPADPIQFFNRYTGQIETEQVYGEGFLHFTYGNPLGALALHALVKRSIFSRWYGRRMNHPASRAKIAPFIRHYQINTAELADSPESFQSFNEFFYRKLKPSARPIHPSPESVVFPADGRHLGFPNASEMDGIFVKGQRFSLETFLGDSVLARRFERGALVLSRLCPVDYHRFHFPAAGAPDTPRLIAGPLSSVSPIALRRNIHIFSENKRSISCLHSDRFGMILTVEVGATCVGSWDYTFTPGKPVAKGAEKGFFKFGGSSTVTLFEPGRVSLDPDLIQHSRNHTEVYAKMGDSLGRAAK